MPEPALEPRQIITHANQQLSADEIAEVNKRELTRSEKTILVEEYKSRELMPEEMDYVLSDAKPKRIARTLDITTERVKAIRKATRQQAK